MKVIQKYNTEIGKPWKYNVSTRRGLELVREMLCIHFLLTFLWKGEMVWAAFVLQAFSCFSSPVSALTSCFVIVSLLQRNCCWPSSSCLRAQDYRENTVFLFSHPVWSPWPEDVDLASFQRVNGVIRKSRRTLEDKDTLLHWAPARNYSDAGVWY